MSLLSLFFFLFPSVLYAKQPLLLSQDYVIKKVLSSGPFSKKAELQKKQILSGFQEKRYQIYDLKVFSGFNKLDRENPGISPFEPLEEDSQTFTFGLEKKLSWGLNIRTLYSDFSRDTVNSEFLSRTAAPAFNYKKNLYLELSVDLLKNVLGFQERAAFSVLKAGEQITEWKYIEETEQMALKAASQYWKTYALWAAFEQQQKGLQTYKRLVREIKRKTKYQFLKPGEGPQTFVEYENIKRKIRATEQEYKNQLKALFVLLNMEIENQKITFFKEPLYFPSYSNSLKIENLRPLKIMREKIKEQEWNLKLARSEFLPSLQFQTKTGRLSGGTLRSLRRDTLFSSENSFYELGLSFLYPLFSKSVFSKVQKEQYKLEENQIGFAILKKEIRNQMEALKSQIQVTYDNFKSINRALKYQKQAFSEIKRSFYQGRIDVFELILVENKLRELEMEKARALGKHFLTVLEWKALADQLVENYTHSI